MNNQHRAWFQHVLAMIALVTLVGCGNPPADNKDNKQGSEKQTSEGGANNNGEKGEAKQGTDAGKTEAGKSEGEKTESGKTESGKTEAGKTSEAADTKEKVFVIDVRSKSEWDSGHVEQAVNIPHTEIGDRIGEVTKDKKAKIVLYCAAGARAGRAKTKLEELGYTNVENGGGYDEAKARFK